MKHDGLGAFLSAAVRELVRCDKLGNAPEFLQILGKGLIPSIEKLFQGKTEKRLGECITRNMGVPRISRELMFAFSFVVFSYVLFCHNQSTKKLRYCRKITLFSVFLTYELI